MHPYIPFAMNILSLALIFASHTDGQQHAYQAQQISGSSKDADF